MPHLAPDLILVNTPSHIRANAMRWGLLTLAAYCRSQGHSVQIVDGTKEDVLAQLVGNDLSRTVVGFTATTDVVSTAMWLCHEVKQAAPSALCVLGGAHGTALPEQTLEEGEFDLVVLGEGELTSAEVIEAFKSGADHTRIAGTACRSTNQIIRNERRPYIKQLDMIPQPAFDLIDLEKHVGIGANQHALRCRKIQRAMVLMLSRGCPFSCKFCGSETLWQRKFRYHSVEYSIELIRHLNQQFGIEYCAFRPS